MLYLTNRLHRDQYVVAKKLLGLRFFSKAQNGKDSWIKNGADLTIVSVNNKGQIKKLSEVQHFNCLNNNYYLFFFKKNFGNYFATDIAGLALVSSTSKIKASNALNGGLAFAP